MASTHHLPGLSTVAPFPAVLVETSAIARPRCNGGLEHGEEGRQACEDGIEQVPALFLRGGEQGADDGEVGGAGERNLPEIFCCSFIMQPSRWASLLVNGTLVSVRKRSTSDLRVSKRSSRLWPRRRAAASFAGGGWASWKARPAATIAS